jgi:hypothetical protein
MKAEGTRMADTTYIVLRRTFDAVDEADGGAEPRAYWVVVANDMLADSTRAAVQQFVIGPDGGEGTYVAVPARSFKPMTAETVQTTTLKLEQPDTAA